MKISTRSTFMKVVTLALVLISAACAPKADEAAADSSSTAAKAMLSAWDIGNSAWAYRLDSGGANLTGASFTLVVKYSDNSEVHCDATMTGDETSGAIVSTNCTDPGAGMANGQGGGGSAFDTGGTGTYSNDGTNLQICRHSGTCLTYH